MRPSPAELAALRRSGLSLEGIAAVLGVSVLEVQAWVSELGQVPAEPRERKPWRERVDSTLDTLMTRVLDYVEDGTMHDPKDRAKQAEIALKAIPVLLEARGQVQQGPQIDRDALLAKARKLTAGAVRLRVVA